MADGTIVAGNKDIRIAGGVDVIQQYLNAGVVDEFTIHYSPVFFGNGSPLFAGISKNISVKVKQSHPKRLRMLHSRWRNEPILSDWLRAQSVLKCEPVQTRVATWVTVDVFF